MMPRSIEEPETAERRKDFSEIGRILNLPWKDEPPESIHLMLTDALRRPEGSMVLKPKQGEALYDAMRIGGLLAPMGVGAGKTLTSLLLPVVMQAERPLILTKPALVTQMREAAITYGKHFRLEPVRVESYAKLSVASGARMLQDYKPDLVVADECHFLRHKTSARTKRLLRYFYSHPETMFCGLSGTLTSKSLKDYAHLAYIALGEGSPLPVDLSDLETWASVIDANGIPTTHAFRRMAVLADVARDVEGPLQDRIRTGFYRRLRATEGVVATTSSAADMSLYLIERELQVPPDVELAIQRMHKLWELPDGTELSYALEKRKSERELSCGFFYVWDWPDGREDEEWLHARKNWNRLVRDTLKVDRREIENYERAWDYCSRQESPPQVFNQWKALVEQSGADNVQVYQAFRSDFPEHPVFARWLKYVRDFCRDREVILDSPLLVYNHYLRAEPNNPTFAKWQRVKDRPTPPSVPVWLSEYMIDHAEEWLRSQDHPVILWVEHRAVLKKLEERGIPVYGAGTRLPEDKPISCAASIQAHGTGRNLQKWYNQHILTPPASGQSWEQLLGRMHRPGQLEDEVLCHYYAHTDAFKKAIEVARQDAHYLELTTGNVQKLNLATWIRED
jgi:sarcosine oxidase delta subunit